MEKGITYNYEGKYFLLSNKIIAEYLEAFRLYNIKQNGVSKEECDLLEKIELNYIEIQDPNGDSYKESSSQRQSRIRSSEWSKKTKEILKEIQKREQDNIIKKLEYKNDYQGLEIYKSAIKDFNARDIYDLPVNHFDELLTKLTDIRPSCEINPLNLRYEKSDLYVPFRIVDGHFPFYFETCLGGTPSCPSFKKGAVGTKTYIGTIETGNTILTGQKLISNEPSYFPRTYKITKIEGRAARHFKQCLGNFPKMLIDYLPMLDIKKPEEGLRVKCTSDAFNAASIKSEEYKNPLDIKPILLKLHDEGLTDYFNFTTENNKSNSCNYIPNLINVRLEVSTEPYRCLMSTATVDIKLKNITTYELQLDKDTTEEVLDLLKTPNNLTIETTSSSNSTEGFISIYLPEKIKSWLANNLHCNANYNQRDYINILISQDNEFISENNEFISENLEVDIINNSLNLAANFSNNKNHRTHDDLMNELEISKGCAILAGYVSTINPAPEGEV